MLEYLFVFYFQTFNIWGSVLTGQSSHPSGQTLWFWKCKSSGNDYSIPFSVFCPSNEELGNHKFLIYYFMLYLFLTGQRRAKYLVHLFSILSCSRTHIWSYWIYISNWHMVCGLCSCWIAAWTGFRNSYFLLFTSKQTDVMEIDEFLLAFDFFCWNIKFGSLFSLVRVELISLWKLLR